MLRVVQLSNSASSAPEAGPASPPGVIVGVGSAAEIAAQGQSWLQAATFTLTEDACADRRVVTVDSVPETLTELRTRCEHWPHASSVCDDVLRAGYGMFYGQGIMNSYYQQNFASRRGAKGRPTALLWCENQRVQLLKAEGMLPLEAARFSRGRDSRGYLAAFVPRGWVSTTLGGDPRHVAIGCACQ